MLSRIWYELNGLIETVGANKEDRFMKQIRMSHSEEEFELDNVYNETDERYKVADTSIWYN